MSAWRSIDAEVLLRNALRAASDAPFGALPPTGNCNANNDPKLLHPNPLTGTNAIDSLAQQFQVVARVAHALRYLDTSLGALGAQGLVTTFTASDFGRTFTSNGDGTDHGWGAHPLVMGGAVKGGDLYGNFPVLGTKNTNNNNFDSSPNQLGNGALLPETSVNQLGATLGRWFDLSDGQFADIFPNLANFDAEKRNLGFMT